MILFSRKKKIQLDRNAGLVFCWRGCSTGNTGGLTLAIVLATSIFALGVLGIKVYVSSESPPSRYRAEIIQVSQIDPNLRWLLERNSPHLNPWYSNQNELGLLDICDKMYDAIDASRDDEIRWNSVLFDDYKLVTTRIFEQGEVVLPNLARYILPVVTETPAEIEWVFSLSSLDQKMLLRFPDQMEYPTDNIKLAKYQGRTLNFTVNIDAGGSVVSCLLLDWITEPEVKIVENWVNTLQFKKAKDGDEKIETLIVSVRLSEGRDAK